MKIFKLDALHQPNETVNDFDSLVWVERYQVAGDFKLEVLDQISILSQLPLGTLISHTNTKEVMIVENHEFDRTANKSIKVTVSGRSFETFAEQRVTLGSEQPLEDEITGDAIVESVGPLSSADVAAYLLAARLEDGTASANDEITNLVVDTDMRDPDAVLTHTIKRGDIYTRVLELLKLGDAGLKTIRPNGAQTTMNLVVHDGDDLTDTVIFYAQNEDLSDAKYLWSIKNYKNYAMVAAKIFALQYRQRDVGSTQTGLNRRIMYEEAPDLEGDYVAGSTDDPVEARAQTVMGEKKMVALIQATISPTARPKFKINYDVGDLVTVYGEFGASQIMRVTEHILTVDKDGMRGFPSLNIL